ncbi:MAG TPA: penicillin-binding transpeptidase domain-containing protein [Patescibacteria group bacterium]|nr:penicillin-binding transpeptidase domain-containing protein [Patescibacteria group bacterium]
MKVGFAFADSIHTEKLSKRRNYSSGKTFRMRAFLFPVLAGLFSLILIGRLFLIQVVAGQYYRNLSDSNRIRTSVIHSPRGIIFDRNGKPLVLNTPGYREVVNEKTVLLSTDEALSKIAKGEKGLEIDNLRKYPFAEAAAHVVGYIGQISPDQLTDPLYSDYQSGDLIGKMGVEQSFEALLRGTDGKVLTEVDATGKPVRTLGQTDPLPGQNISLTLDADLQQAVFTAMKDIKKGAAIVSTPQGQVLAIVSKPSFDPNIFTMGDQYQPPNSDEYENVAQILTDGDGQPLLDRAIAGTYPPGSTFKIVTAAAGLETHTIDSSYTVDDEGILKVGNFSFANWYFTQYGRTEGQVDVVKAIKRSNDIFFYKLGQLLGVDKLSAEAAKFGIGKKLGIPLYGEASGLLPTKEWKQKVIGEQWYLGDDYHYGIGQGYLLTTPLQVNAWTQVIANGGTLYQPQLLMGVTPLVKQSGLLSSSTLSLIREGMVEACDTGGVAWPLFNFSVKNPHLTIDNKNILPSTTATDSANLADAKHVVLACKTGTAQHGDDATLPHAWITVFAPAYNPQIVVTVLSESSGEGSNVAGPVAKTILDYYFSR